MINPLMLFTNIKRIQKEVMAPLYTTNYLMKEDHSKLLEITGRRIMDNEAYIVDICNSNFIRIGFNIIKKLGGCKDLQIEDFDRFTNYVKDDGLTAMMIMLKSDNKEKAFLDELDRLPERVRDNAYAMLTKSRWLHEDFVTSYLIKAYYTMDKVPIILTQHLKDTNRFMDRLVELAHHEDQMDELVREVGKIGSKGNTITDMRMT